MRLFSSNGQTRAMQTAELVAKFGDWLDRLENARQSGTLAPVRQQIEQEIGQIPLPRLAVSVGQLDPRARVTGSDKALDYLWLRYGAKGVPATPQDFASVVDAASDFIIVPPRLVKFYTAENRSAQPVNDEWTRNYRLASAREQISFDIELSGQSLQPFVDPAAADAFAHALGTSGPVLMLASHLGYRRLRAYLGTTFARDVTAAGASTSIDKAKARELAFRAMKSLANGGVLFIAPDGPSGEHRQTVNLGGLSIDISTGASRLAFDAKARVVFFTVHFRQGRFMPHFRQGPVPTPEDTRAGFVEKVTRFYESCLSDILWGDPAQLVIPFQFYPVLSTTQTS